MTSRSRVVRASTLIALFAVYVITARIGLSLASLNPSATPVWPPSGIAIAMTLILGSWIWPAIAAGAFVTNLLTAGPVLTSLGIATGNTLEALLAAALITRWAGGRNLLFRAPDVF